MVPLMNHMARALETVELIDEKYTARHKDVGVWEWIAVCLSTPNEMNALWYKECLITFLSSEAEMFNISVFCKKTNCFLCDQTVLLRPFLVKYFGVDTLEELHTNITCTKEDLHNLVNEIEWELSAFM